MTVSGRAIVYCGTPPVSALNTLGLLESPFHAIWCPPSARRVKLAAGDPVWLVWLEGATSAPQVLGGGRLRATRDGQLLWTNRTAPGIRELAREFGYRGPTNMAFLRLERPRIAPASLSLSGLGRLPSGLSEATEAQHQLLESALPLLE
jgi:hypothetical protein